MKKRFIHLALILLVLPSILAISIDVEKTSSNEVLIADLDKPAIFDLQITNYGPSDSFEFYNLLGFNMFPVGTTFIGGGQTKSVEMGITPLGSFPERGFYTFSYYIRGQDNSEVREELTFKIIDLEDAFEIGSGEVDPDSNSIEIYIHNKENFDFGEMDVKFSSVFFDLEESFPLGPNERKSFEVQLDKEDFRSLMAGFYTLTADIDVEDRETKVEGLIKFVEKDLVTTTKRDFGLIINTRVIEKKNEGNTVIPSETVIKKNIISRLFTSFSPQPDIVEREGATVYYTWTREIKPGETLEIVVKTNWLFPLIVILFIIAIVILAKQYSRTNLVLRKKVAFVKAKGGEFALKITIFLNAKNYIERINLIDRLPPLVKVYERFGGEQPSRVDEKGRRLEWNFEKLEAGEVRTISYVIYSKVGVLGKFALPTATAIFERDGDIQETESNRAFFVAEQRKKDVEEE
jgi:hypothetical protein